MAMLQEFRGFSVYIILNLIVGSLVTVASLQWCLINTSKSEDINKKGKCQHIQKFVTLLAG